MGVKSAHIDLFQLQSIYPSFAFFSTLFFTVVFGRQHFPFVEKREIEKDAILFGFQGTREETQKDVLLEKREIRRG